MARNFSEDGAIGAGSSDDSGGNFGVGGGSFTSDSGGGMQQPNTNFGSGAPSSDSGYNPAGIAAGARGLAGIDQTGNLNPAGTSSRDGTPGVGARATASGLPDLGNWSGGGFATGLAFEDGGAIPDGDEDSDPNATDPQGSALGASVQRSIDSAMKTVQDALSYGRNLHGLGSGGDQQASRMPMQPGNQSESGVPREQPMPGPLPPTKTPFGKRTEGAIDDGSFQTAGVMPSAPYSETPKPQPMPGPLPPTSNPFGKRADAGDDAAPEAAIEEDA